MLVLKSRTPLTVIQIILISPEGTQISLRQYLPIHPPTLSLPTGSYDSGACIVLFYCRELIRPVSKDASIETRGERDSIRGEHRDSTALFPSLCAFIVLAIHQRQVNETSLGLGITRDFDFLYTEPRLLYIYIVYRII